MSQHTAKKSENMISAIGRRPVIAAPIAAPSIACSLIGVSRTRTPPNSSRSSEYRLLTDRSVADTNATELLEEPHRALEDTTGRAHVFAEEHHGFVAPHLLGDTASYSFSKS